MSGFDHQQFRSLALSFCLHIAVAVVLMIGWNWHAERKTIAPPAMMKAALVYAPKSTLKPQQKTQTQKTEKPKPEPKPEPEPPKPEVKKPQETKPEIKPTDKPSPVAAKPEQEKPKPKQEAKKPDPEKKEAAKTAKQAEKAQKALSQKEKEKISKDAEMAIEALLNDEDVTRMGELTDDELGRWIGLISSRIEDNWNRPPNARRDMKVLLEIELAPNGQVINVSVIESSGNTAFDLAAETAVRKVEKFEEIKDMKPDVFDAHFRKFRLLFNPEDLLM